MPTAHTGSSPLPGNPPSPARTYLDAYGNVCDRLSLPVGSSVLRCDATVEVTSSYDDADKGAAAVALEDLPDEAFVYLLSSRFCWPDMLQEAAWGLFASAEPGWARVQAVCDWVQENIRYEVGASTAVTTAHDVWTSRVGVCRDFAQLGITCAGLSMCRPVTWPGTCRTSPSRDPTWPWTSVRGSRCGSTGGGGCSIPATTNPVSGGW